MIKHYHILQVNTILFGGFFPREIQLGFVVFRLRSNPPLKVNPAV